jgi:hypothetical protein
VQHAGSCQTTPKCCSMRAQTCFVFKVTHHVPGVMRWNGQSLKCSYLLRGTEHDNQSNDSGPGHSRMCACAPRTRICALIDLPILPSHAFSVEAWLAKESCTLRQRTAQQIVSEQSGSELTNTHQNAYGTMQCGAICLPMHQQFSQSSEPEECSHSHRGIV